MTAKDWREKSRKQDHAAVVDLKLPSGMVIKARRPDPAHMLIWGHLPLGLASSAIAAEDGEDGSVSAVPTDPEEFLAGIQFARDVLTYCCVSPRISLTPKGDDEIHPRDIGMADATFIIGWATRREEAESIRRFRDRGNVTSAGERGRGVRSTSVGDGGDPGPSPGAGVRPGVRSGLSESGEE